MSGVLHPVGPEPASTYWLRRALVIGTLAVVVAVMTALLGGRNGPQQAVSAVPASITPTTTAPAPTSSATVAAPTTSPTASKPTTTKSSAAPNKEKAPDTKAPETKAPEKKAPERKAPEKKAPAKKATPLCDPDVLRPTLTGKQTLEPKEDNTFTLSMINGGAATCAVSVNAENFELKIHSGKDRIWSTGDCSTAVKSVVKDVSSQQAVEWKMTWNGRRSADGCKNRAEIPQPGTYVATATLEGSKPVRLRMTLTD